MVSVLFPNDHSARRLAHPAFGGLRRAFERDALCLTASAAYGEIGGSTSATYGEELSDGRVFNFFIFSCFSPYNVENGAYG